MRTHTPGPWKIMQCPIHVGKHPLHDCRWIATADAEVEFSPHVPNDWTLASGSLICEMRDTSCQPHDARLIAAAPALYEALKELWPFIEADEVDVVFGQDDPYQKAIQKARAALAEGGQG